MDENQLAELTAKLRAVVSRLRRRLREQGSIGDLTQSQSVTLQRIEREGPATVSQLARAEGLRPQSMGTIVSTLAEAGLIAGVPDPADRRQTLFSLTPACVEKLAVGRLAHQEWLANQLRHLSRGEQALLATATDILERISNH